jgi:hypothetical protein
MFDFLPDPFKSHARKRGEVFQKKIKCFRMVMDDQGGVDEIFPGLMHKKKELMHIFCYLATFFVGSALRPQLNEICLGKFHTTRLRGFSLRMQLQVQASLEIQANCEFRNAYFPGSPGQAGG